MVDKGDAAKIGASEEIVQQPDASLKKKKIGEPDINPGGASSLTADTPKRRENLSKDPVQRMRVYLLGVLRQSTSCCVTCYLLISAEMALHSVESSRKMN